MGTIQLTASISGGRQFIIHALVSPDLFSNMLVSWHDLIASGVLPTNFPNCAVAQAARAETTVAQAAEALKEEFSDVFSDKLKDTPMATAPMSIKLTDGARLRKVTTARQVPLRFQDEAEKTIKDLVDKGVIKRVSEPTDWSSPAFFVPKPDNKRVRLVTDYTSLNKWVKRPVHPFPSSRDIMQAIPASAKMFAKLDCVHGYFQLAIDEPSSFLTTFLLPSGRYRYLRAPMGLTASSDEWCFASDALIEGLPFARKIVDDILIWGEDLRTLIQRARVILLRCRTENVTISAKKFEMGECISFAGFVIGAEGIKPDPNMVASLTQFPRPANPTDVRSFLGLAQQLGHFVPDLAHMQTQMRGLTNKGVAWQWLQEHEDEFNNIKRVLTSPLVVQPFDPNLDTVLLTDAARLHGLGYILLQQEPGKQRLIICGSRSLTGAQKRYATVELEALAIIWAIGKCDYYLRGLPSFRVITDHKPLLGVFDKELHEIDNPRLQRLREKVTAYTFKLAWVAGKDHHMADALSRYPHFGPEEDDSTEQNNTAVQVFQAARDPALDSILNGISGEYKLVIEALKSSTPPNNLHNEHPAKVYSGIWDRLSIYSQMGEELILVDSGRILVPARARADILRRLHLPHQGETKTLALATQLYYWPSMKNDIRSLVRSCQACMTLRPSNQKEPLTLPSGSSAATAPMSHVGVDLYDLNGQAWLVMVDRYSGFPFTHRLTSTTTSAVTATLSSWFHDFGWPTTIRSDGGPQFRTEFANFCADHNIVHELASAHNPQSNGLAEAAVKTVKTLQRKCIAAGENFKEALTEWRNTPRADGYSPAQMFFGRRQRSQLPTLPMHHLRIADESAEACRQATACKAKDAYDSSARALTPLSIGQDVLMQHHVTKRWDKLVRVTAARPEGHSYEVHCFDDGRTYIRNRRLLMPASATKKEKANTPSSPRAPRRSERIQNQSSRAPQ